MADIQLISKFNKRFRFLLCVIDIFSKYAWVVLLKGVCIVDAFQKILDKSGRKPSKIWVDKSSDKWSDPVDFLKSQGKFFLSIPCTLFLHIFDT